MNTFTRNGEIATVRARGHLHGERGVTGRVERSRNIEDHSVVDGDVARAWI